MKPIITLQWNSEAEKSLRPMLIDAGIQFEEREMFLKGGSVVAAGVSIVEIVEAVGGLGLAGLLIAWINAKASRSVQITKTENSVAFITKGMSADEVKQILKSAKNIGAIEIPWKKQI